MSKTITPKDEPVNLSGQGPIPWLLSRREAVASLAGGFLLLASLPLGAQDNVVDHYPWLEPLVTEDGFTRQELHRLLGNLQPDQKVLGLMDRQAEAKPYHEYRKQFLTSQHLRIGQEMLRQHQATFQTVEERYHVPASVITALWGVESYYGRSQGNFSVLKTLFSLATGYPRRAKFFQDELRQFLILSREEGWNPATITGSYAGALGQCQMMPSSVRKYAVDFNGDGKRDLFNRVEDVLASIAAYLAKHQWRPNGIYTMELPAISLPSSVREERIEQNRPWREWRQFGVVPPTSAPKPDPEDEARLITLEGENGPRYYMVFANFRVVMQWNRSYRFAMVVGELSEQLQQKG